MTTSTIGAPRTPRPAPSPGGTPLRRITPMRVLLTVAVVLLAAGALLISSLALFTDTATVTDNTFTTGTLDISASPASTVVTASNMAPGDQVTAPLTVSNDGSLELRYAVESTTSEDVLAAALVLTVKSGVTTCNNASWAATGTDLYSGRLGSTATDAIIGSDATGFQAGDRVLPGTASAPANAEVLCINVTLPSSATTGQGTTTTATLDFLAEQTANN